MNIYHTPSRPVLGIVMTAEQAKTVVPQLLEMGDVWFSLAPVPGDKYVLEVYPDLGDTVSKLLTGELVYTKLSVGSPLQLSEEQQHILAHNGDFKTGGQFTNGAVLVWDLLNPYHPAYVVELNGHIVGLGRYWGLED